MFPETLYPKTAQVLKRLQGQPFLDGFYLAGGTALALQLGHRKSIDLDFFTSNFPKQQLLLNALEPYKPQIIQEAPGTIDTIIDTVKVTFLSYPYRVLEEGSVFDNVPLASIIDIACMKLSAISSRGAKKDFVDMYFILKRISLNELLIRFSAKFARIQYNDVHIMKSLTYFVDADADPDPDMLHPISWQEVKSSLEQLTLSYFNA